MNRFTQGAVGLALFSMAAAASAAAPDVTAAVTEIEGMAGPVGLIGGASLLIAVGIKIWKRLRGVA